VKGTYMSHRRLERFAFGIAQHSVRWDHFTAREVCEETRKMVREFLAKDGRMATRAS
jgi:hypothetical protein